MLEPRTQRLLAFARRLQRADSFGELLQIVGEEAKDRADYRHTWLMVGEDDALESLRLIEISSSIRELVWEVAPILRVKGDAFLEEVVSSDQPVVIVDARTDPRTNKELVRKLENRTLIKIPLRILDRPLGVFGLGTFGDEGCRAPSPDELDYFVGMAAQISVAVSRLRLLEARSRAEKERLDLERRLLQVQKLESLGLLAGGIAHDFNNLLTVILSSASLAEAQAPEGSLREDIQAVLEAATRARDVTRQLLAMSRSQELQLKPLNMNERLVSLLDLGRRILPESVRIELTQGAELPWIEGDASQLDQVFMNLLINARDAMPGGGRVAVSTEQVVINGSYVDSHPWAKPGRFVMITVTDTGSGMPREVLDRIFEPFFTTKAPKVGTGLGLAVAYGIVRQHAGLLHCYSEVGLGTTFKVYLPVLSRSAASVGDKVQEEVPRGSERILVAEDDELVRGVAVRILRGSGYQVSAVENGDAACQLAATEDFDVIVLDMVMPGMSCRETIQQLRRLRPSVPILIASGYAGGDTATNLVQDEQLSMLRKPYDPDQVLRAVRAALDRAQRT